MRRHLLRLVFLAWAASVPVRAHFIEAAEPELYPACGPVTYTWGTKYPGCDLEPPDVLHVYAISRMTCANWGGVWGGYVKVKTSTGYTTICYYVDY